MATAAQRAHVKSVLDMLWTYRDRLDYPPHDHRDHRDTDAFNLTESAALHLLESGGRLQFDCSEQDAWVLKCAGLWPFGGPGYTGSHLAMLPRYTDGTLALVGALVVFGPGTGHHEAVVYQADPKGGDPLCQEHGRPGEARNRVSVIAARQAAEGYPGVRYLSIAHL